MRHKSTNDTLADRSKAMLRAQVWAQWIVGGSISAGSFILYLRSMPFPPHGENLYRVLLLVAVAAMVGLWILNSHREIDLLCSLLHPKQYGPPTSAANSLLIVLLAVVLSALFYATRDPFFFGLVFVAYALIDFTYSKYVVQPELEALFFESEQAISAQGKSHRAIDSHGFTILRGYYMDRRHFTRRFVVLIMAAAGLALAWRGNLGHSTCMRVHAYQVYLAALFLPEAVISLWRYQRDRAIRDWEQKHREFSA